MLTGPNIELRPLQEWPEVKVLLQQKMRLKQDPIGKQRFMQCSRIHYRYDFRRTESRSKNERK
jgi:hypothetical protein